MKGEFNLVISIHGPIRTDVWGTIVQNQISFEVFEFFLDQTETSLSGDIALECHAPFNSWNLIQIDTDFDGCDWHVFGADLQPILKQRWSEYKFGVFIIVI